METKKGDFVSGVRDSIINTAIESLRTEGLKFSVDTVAARLKMSKKTIYKLFPDKEALAYAIYERYYADALEKVRQIEKSGGNIKYLLLAVYQDALFMIRREIFNKYKLNDRIYAYVVKHQNELWAEIMSLIAPSSSEEDEAVMRAIIEGAFEKAWEYSIPAEAVAERLVTLL